MVAYPVAYESHADIGSLQGRNTGRMQVAWDNAFLMLVL
jgi:hypothetical protein